MVGGYTVGVVYCRGMVKIKDSRGVEVEVGEKGLSVVLVRDLKVPGIGEVLKAGGEPMTLKWSGGACCLLGQWFFNASEVSGAFDVVAEVKPGLYAVDRKNLPVSNLAVDGEKRGSFEWSMLEQSSPRCAFFWVDVGASGEVSCRGAEDRGASKGLKVTFKAKVGDILASCTRVEETSLKVLPGLYAVDRKNLRVSGLEVGGEADSRDVWYKYPQASTSCVYFWVKDGGEGEVCCWGDRQRGVGKSTGCEATTFKAQARDILESCTFISGIEPEVGVVVGGLYYISSGVVNWGGAQYMGYSADNELAIYFTVLSVDGDKAKVQPYKGEGFFGRSWYQSECTVEDILVSDIQTKCTLVAKLAPTTKEVPTARVEKGVIYVVDKGRLDITACSSDGVSREYRTAWNPAEDDDYRVYFTVKAGASVGEVAQCLRCGGMGVGKREKGVVLFKAKVEDILASCSVMKAEGPWLDNTVGLVTGILAEKVPGVTEKVVRAFIVGLVK